MSVVYTIGYEATDIDRFVRTLKAVGVLRLADVRAVAASRKKGFSKTKLSERLADEGIEYIHFVDLGDPKPGREAARSGQYDLFRSIYSHHLDTEDSQISLRLLTATVKDLPTCLLCFERDPETCHRSIVAREIAGELGFEIFNLFADDPEKYVRNASRLPRFHPCEGTATA